MIVGLNNLRKSARGAGEAGRKTVKARETIQDQEVIDRSDIREQTRDASLRLACSLSRPSPPHTAGGEGLVRRLTRLGARTHHSFVSFTLVNIPTLPLAHRSSPFLLTRGKVARREGALDKKRQHSTPLPSRVKTLTLALTHRSSPLPHLYHFHSHERRTEATPAEKDGRKRFVL